MAENVRDIPVGLQLYSVRHECEKDEGKNFPNVVRAVAQMGYQGVEFAGYYGWEADDIRRVLEDNAICCCGAHVGIQSLLGDELERSVEFHRTIGNRFLIVPGLPEQYRDSLDAWKRTADLFNDIAERLAPHGMVTGYHNHTVEFQPIDGRTPWEVLFERTVPGVVMQLDIGNAIHGGGDCIATLRKFPHRATTLHIKEFGGPPEAVVGEGEVDWPAMLRAIGQYGGTEWNIIEHERDPARALADVERCFQKFRQMLETL